MPSERVIFRFEMTLTKSLYSIIKLIICEAAWDRDNYSNNIITILAISSHNRSIKYFMIIVLLYKIIINLVNPNKIISFLKETGLYNLL